MLSSYYPENGNEGDATPLNELTISIAHIAAPQTPDSGDFIYRVRGPGAALGALPGARAFSLTTACTDRERIMREADVLVIQMLGDPDILPVITERKRRRRLTVFEVSDNFLAFQKHNPAAAFYDDPAARALLLQYLSLCHGAQFSTSELSKRFSKFNGNSAVFINRAQSVAWPQRPDAPLTIGWGGSSGHYEDVRALAPAFAAWLKRNPDARLAVMSDARIAALFDAVPQNRKRIESPGSLEKYYSFVETLHIGLAPLADHEFNQCRSDVKFLEYASRGVVPVCADVATYSGTLKHGETGFLFSNMDEMIATLDRLSGDGELRGRVARAAFEYARDERAPADDARARLDFYLNLIRDFDLEVCGGLDEYTKLPRAENTPGTNHYFIGFGGMESDIHDGLMSLVRNHDNITSARFMGRAVKTEPDCAHAHFFYANVLAIDDKVKAITHLSRAIELNPDACAAPLLLARIQIARGNADEAKTILKNLLKRNPECAQGHALEAGIHRAAGRIDLALDCLERALEANPHDAPAAANAAALYVDSGNPGRARSLFDNAVALCPHIAAFHIGLGAALHQLGDVPLALESMERAMELEPKNDGAADYIRDTAKQEYKSGNIDIAIERLKRLSAQRPSDPDTAFWLARAYERKGDAARAHALWRFLSHKEKSGKYKNAARQKLKET